MLHEIIDGVTMGTLMQRVWQVHGRTEVPYPTDDLRNGLAHVLDDERFANDFFPSYITGQD